MSCIFHVHTYRCGHASNEPDENYIEAAIKLGADSIWLTDHAPFPDNPFTGRMKIEQLDEYVTSLNKLKDKYKDIIEIHIGLEAEYMPSYINYYKALKAEKGIECLVLGQHHYEIGPNVYNFQNSKRMPEDDFIGIMIAQIEGIETGLFDFIAHPDRCFKFLDYARWDEVKQYYTKRLIRSVLDNNVTLERNLTSMRNPGQYCIGFWKLVPEVAKVIIGCDAHCSKDVRFRND